MFRSQVAHSLPCTNMLLQKIHESDCIIIDLVKLLLPLTKRFVGIPVLNVYGMKSSVSYIGGIVI